MVSTQHLIHIMFYIIELKLINQHFVTVSWALNKNNGRLRECYYFSYNILYVLILVRYTAAHSIFHTKKN